MKRILQRLFLTLTVSGGLVAATATTANALAAQNHTEPVARDHK